MKQSTSIDVLVVDDAPEMVDLLTLLLSLDLRFQVVTSAGSGEDAITAFAMRAPDVVLLDYRLPGMNGIEAARAMKQLRPQTKIVMVTAYDAADVKGLDNAGDIEAIISKRSFSLERLQEALGLSVSSVLREDE